MASGKHSRKTVVFQIAMKINTVQTSAHASAHSEVRQIEAQVLSALRHKQVPASNYPRLIYFASYTMASEDLAAKVAELTALVTKQSQTLAQTGKQVLELQMKDIKTKMASMDAKPAKIDTEDFATNEDIVQLVGELQGQLDHMEDRNIKRIANSAVTATSDRATPIAPLSTRDGEPAPLLFPRTVGALQDLLPIELLRLCDYYELIEPAEPEDLSSLLKNEEMLLEQAQQLFAPQKQDILEEERVQQLSPEEVNEIFDEFARFIGVRLRRGLEW